MQSCELEEKAYICETFCSIVVTEHVAYVLFQGTVNPATKKITNI